MGCEWEWETIESIAFTFFDAWMAKRDDQELSSGLQSIWQQEGKNGTSTFSPNSSLHGNCAKLASPSLMKHYSERPDWLSR